MIRPELKRAMVREAERVFIEAMRAGRVCTAEIMLDAAMAVAADWKPTPGFPPGETNEFINVAKHWKE